MSPNTLSRFLPPWLAALALPLCAQPLQVFDHAPEAYLGADACGTCHSDQMATQSDSGHARSLAPAPEHALAASFTPSRPVVRTGGVSYSYGTSRDGLRVEVAARGDRLDLQLEWAFGAGEQAVTFVGQADEDHYVEHHLSYYAATKSFATTPGHRDEPARDLEDALGVRYRTFAPKPAIMRCFQCHSTGPLALGDRFSLRPRELGIRCEACHGPGRDHVQAIGSGNLEAARAAVGNPARLGGADLLSFCGACHRPPASSGEVVDWSDPWNVRHQPVYLARSACYQRSDDALACMRCHDPHEPLERAAARAEGRCMDCHAEALPPVAACRQSPQRDCADCHMPVVEPQSNLRFTNHWIGVYDRSSLLRPRDRSASRAP